MSGRISCRLIDGAIYRLAVVQKKEIQMGSQTGGSSVGAGSQVIEGEGGGGQETC